MKRLCSLAFAVAMGVLVMSCSKQNAGNSAANPRPAGGGGDLAGLITNSQQNSGPPIMPFEKPPIIDINVLLATNGEAYWTRTVELSNVKVQRILAGRLFMLVGPDSDRTVVVHVSVPNPENKEGQHVDISGILDPLGSLSQWNLSPQQQQALASHTMYISASTVRPASQR